MAVEGTCRKGELRADAVVVGERSLVVVVGGRAQPEIRSLVGEGRLGEDADQSSHRVASVEGSLRAAHYVDAFHIGIVEVEGRLVDEGDVVDIQSDCRRVDARADAPDIHRGGQLRAVVGDEEVGHERRERLDRSDGVVAHVFLRERGCRHRLLPQAAVFFRGGDDHHSPGSVPTALLFVAAAADAEASISPVSILCFFMLRLFFPLAK